VVDCLPLNFCLQNIVLSVILIYFEQNQATPTHLMLASSLLMRFSSSSRALAFLRSAMNCTNPRMFELLLVDRPRKPPAVEAIAGEIQRCRCTAQEKESPSASSTREPHGPTASLRPHHSHQLWGELEAAHADTGRPPQAWPVTRARDRHVANPG